ncbi:MAG: Na+/H+ antiporter NhaC family protein [Calditrichia bacterium]
MESPRVVLTNVPFHITIKPKAGFWSSIDSARISYQLRKLPEGTLLAAGHFPATYRSDQAFIIENVEVNHSGLQRLRLKINHFRSEMEWRVLPGILSILPPLLAILLALLTRQVIVALFAGIWTGVSFIYDYNPLLGFLHTLDEYLVQALADPQRISILIFSLVLGGMVGVITRSGGMQGIVERLSRYARNARFGQLATWGMGILIFFDDYANTLLVGNTMRPLADKLRISREKLSYLVDSTAAPVANVAIISTWIGYEISLIDQSFNALGMQQNAYLIFIKTIPYNFYPLYTLFFGFLIAFLMRDFGSMYRAEIRTRRTGEVLRPDATPLTDLTESGGLAPEGIPLRWLNGFLPVMIVILTVAAGLIYTGWQGLQTTGITADSGNLLRYFSRLIGQADSFAVLMWAAFAGSVAAIVLAVSQRLLSLQEAMDAWVKGIRSMIMAALILTAAWAIGTICQDLFTADYVIHLTRTFLTPHWLPLITFLSAAVVSFATGTSWGTMAILMPIAIPLAFKFPQTLDAIGEAHRMALMLSNTAAVLAGATFGDHCSPISDTTIMSSMASGADHIDHVRTQLPYALTVGLIASVFGYLPVGFGLTGWWVLLPGFLVIFLVVRFAGKKTG